MAATAVFPPGRVRPQAINRNLRVPGPRASLFWPTGRPGRGGGGNGPQGGSGGGFGLGGLAGLGVGAAGLAIFVKMASIISDVTKRSMELEDNFVSIEKVLDIATANTAKFRQELVGAALSIKGISLDEFMEIERIAGRMGIAKEQIHDFTKTIAIASSAIDDLTAEAAAEGLGKLLTITGRSSKEVAALAGTINMLSQRYQINSKELIDVTLRAQGYGEAIGISVEQTMAIATALKEAGVHTEVAGSSLVVLMQRLARSPYDVAKAFKLSNAEIERFTDLVATNPFEALKTLFKSLQNKSGTEVANILEALDIEGVKHATTLTGLVKTYDNLNGIMTVAGDVENNIIELHKEHDIKARTLSSSFVDLKKEVEAFIAALDTDHLKDFVDGLSQLAREASMVAMGLGASGILSGDNPLFGPKGAINKWTPQGQFTRWITGRGEDRQKQLQKESDARAEEDKALWRGEQLKRMFANAAKRRDAQTVESKNRMREADERRQKDLQEKADELTKTESKYLNRRWKNPFQMVLDIREKVADAFKTRQSGMYNLGQMFGSNPMTRMKEVQDFAQTLKDAGVKASKFTGYMGTDHTGKSTPMSIDEDDPNIIKKPDGSLWFDGGATRGMLKLTRTGTPNKNVQTLFDALFKSKKDPPQFRDFVSIWQDAQIKAFERSNQNKVHKALQDLMDQNGDLFGEANGFLREIERKLPQPAFGA